MNTKDLFDLVGTVTVSKNYVGNVTIPNVPGIDDEGGHDDWVTKFCFSNIDDLHRLIDQGKRSWFGDNAFPFPIDVEDGCVSFTYSGLQAYKVAQYLMSVETESGTCGMDSMISWLCNVINPILDHIEEDTGKVTVVTREIIAEMSKEDAYVTVRKVLDFKELSEYPKAEEALRMAAYYMERMLDIEHKEDKFHVSGWDAVYDLRDLIEDEDYEDIIIVRKHRKAIEKAYRCLRASI